MVLSFNFVIFFSVSNFKISNNKDKY